MVPSPNGGEGYGSCMGWGWGGDGAEVSQTVLFGVRVSLVQPWRCLLSLHGRGSYAGTATESLSLPFPVPVPLGRSSQHPWHFWPQSHIQPEVASGAQAGTLTRSGGRSQAHRFAVIHAHPVGAILPPSANRCLCVRPVHCSDLL